MKAQSGMNDQETDTDSTADAGSPVEFTFSDGFFDWLAGEQISLLASTYQAGRLLVIGALEKAPWIKHYPFRSCMGFCHRDGLLVASTGNHIVLMNHLEGDLSASHFEEGTDRVFYPRTAWVTGNLRVHDMVWTDGGQLVFVNTAYDCLATVDMNYSFRPLWRPGYLAHRDPLARDCSHLNGLCLEDGELAYVTALGKSTEPRGWRAHKSSGGLLFDVRTGDILSECLSMPHSPRVYGDTLWLLNSGTGEFGYLDRKTGTFEPTTFCPGFARGLAFHRDWALVTLSDMRRAKGFQGLELEERLDHKKPLCGLLAINIRTGRIEHWLQIRGDVQEFYDVAVLEGICRPSLVTMDQSITRDIHLPPPAQTFESLPTNAGVA